MIKRLMFGMVMIVVVSWFRLGFCEVDETLLPNLASLDSTQEKLNTHSDQEKSDYVLAVGDKIMVKIFPEDPYIKGGEMEVSSEGNITLSLVGKVHVADLKIVEAEKAVAEIIDRDYIVNPEVVIERRRKDKEAAEIGPSFLVLGAVKQPNTYHFPQGEKSLTLLKAISMAGGFSDVANIKKIKIVRDDKGRKTSIRANAEDILEGKEKDVPIKGGDIIHVSESLF